MAFPRICCLRPLQGPRLVTRLISWCSVVNPESLRRTIVTMCKACAKLVQSLCKLMSKGLPQKESVIDPVTTCCQFYQIEDSIAPFSALE